MYLHRGEGAARAAAHACRVQLAGHGPEADARRAKAPRFGDCSLLGFHGL